MSFWKRLESRFARWAIPNLTAVIISGQVLLYLLVQARGPAALAKIDLEPAMVLQGEVWRLVTFAFIPPQTNLLFAFIYWMLFYRFGSTLEVQWGTVRYNVFLLIGLIANIIAVFIAWSSGVVVPATNAFLYSTVFLAFARLYPHFIIQVFFILPVEIKWLALLMWIGLGYGLVIGSWMSRLLIIASVVNYLIFFGREHWRDVYHGHRRRSFQRRATQTSGPLHRCRVCGLDSDSSPKTSFRYCSKCAGQCCYCPEHIHNHEHVVELEDSREPSRQA